MGTSNICERCLGSGEIPSAAGVPIACPECTGAGTTPTKHDVVDARMRDIERALGAGLTVHATDVSLLLEELRSARNALKQVVALAHDIDDPDQIARRIRFAANRALGVHDSDTPS